ncbi:MULTISPECIES: hypothetical protein [unclassified Streptomyces]|uniref:hypothetical protein n=1 Tax=unclassified Streptomyces TaxID=2593676 RepID=UPI00403D253A
MREFGAGGKAVRREVSRPRVWSAQALWGVEDTPEALVLGDWRLGHWKDEDEYAQGRRLTVVSEAEHQAVERVHGESVAMTEGVSDRSGQWWST